MLRRWVDDITVFAVAPVVIKDKARIWVLEKYIVNNSKLAWSFSSSVTFAFSLSI
jgi:hypothetical protein